MNEASCIAARAAVPPPPSAMAQPARLQQLEGMRPPPRPSPPGRLVGSYSGSGMPSELSNREAGSGASLESCGSGPPAPPAPWKHYRQSARAEEISLTSDYTCGPSASRTTRVDALLHNGPQRVEPCDRLPDSNAVPTARWCSSEGVPHMGTAANATSFDKWPRGALHQTPPTTDSGPITDCLSMPTRETSRSNIVPPALETIQQGSPSISAGALDEGRLPSSVSASVAPPRDRGVDEGMGTSAPSTAAGKPRMPHDSGGDDAPHAPIDSTLLQVPTSLSSTGSFDAPPLACSEPPRADLFPPPPHWVVDPSSSGEIRHFSEGLQRPPSGALREFAPRIQQMRHLFSSSNPSALSQSAAAGAEALRANFPRSTPVQHLEGQNTDATDNFRLRWMQRLRRFSGTPSVASSVISSHYVASPSNQFVERLRARLGHSDFSACVDLHDGFSSRDSHGVAPPMGDSCYAAEESCRGIVDTRPTGESCSSEATAAALLNESYPARQGKKAGHRRNSAAERRGTGGSADHSNRGLEEASLSSYPAADIDPSRGGRRQHHRHHRHHRRDQMSSVELRATQAAPECGAAKLRACSTSSGSDGSTLAPGDTRPRSKGRRANKATSSPKGRKLVPSTQLYGPSHASEDVAELWRNISALSPEHISTLRKIVATLSHKSSNVSLDFTDGINVTGSVRSRPSPGPLDPPAATLPVHEQKSQRQESIAAATVESASLTADDTECKEKNISLNSLQVATVGIRSIDLQHTAIQTMHQVKQSLDGFARPEIRRIAEEMPIYLDSFSKQLGDVETNLKAISDLLCMEITASHGLLENSATSILDHAPRSEKGGSNQNDGSSLLEAAVASFVEQSKEMVNRIEAVIAGDNFSHDENSVSATAVASKAQDAGVASSQKGFDRSTVCRPTQLGCREKSVHSPINDTAVQRSPHAAYGTTEILTSDDVLANLDRQIRAFENQLVEQMNTHHGDFLAMLDQYSLARPASTHSDRGINYAIATTRSRRSEAGDATSENRDQLEDTSSSYRPFEAPPELRPEIKAPADVGLGFSSVSSRYVATSTVYATTSQHSEQPPFQPQDILPPLEVNSGAEPLASVDSSSTLLPRRSSGADYV